MSYIKGIKAENIAVSYLKTIGHEIVSRRYVSYGQGEIDIISKFGTIIHVIEVKYRMREIFAMTSITPKKQQAILNTTYHFLANNQKYRDCDLSFDMLIVSEDRGINYITQAWHY